MTEEKTIQKHQKSSARGEWIRAGLIALLIAAVAGGIGYWRLSSQRVYIDTASISAPLIQLAPSSPGKLQALYVNVGDTVPADTVVARVGNELVKTKVGGLIVSVTDQVGSQLSPNEAVATMIDPSQLRVVGRIDENKGLDRIHVGDPVVFTVDAYGGASFTGVIDEISPTSNQSGIVFNISNQRQVQQFDVKARFDTNSYPQLRNGMSARMWIYGN